MEHAVLCAFLAHGESPKPLVSLASCTLQQKWPTPFYYFMTLRFCRKLDFSSRVSLRAVIVRAGIRIAAAPAGTTRTGKVGGLCVSFKFPCPCEERSGTAIRSPGSRDSAVPAHNPSVTASPCHLPLHRGGLGDCGAPQWLPCHCEAPQGPWQSVPLIFAHRLSLRGPAGAVANPPLPTCFKMCYDILYCISR